MRRRSTLNGQAAALWWLVAKVLRGPGPAEVPALPIVHAERQEGLRVPGGLDSFAHTAARYRHV